MVKAVGGTNMFRLGSRAIAPLLLTLVAACTVPAEPPDAVDAAPGGDPRTVEPLAVDPTQLRSPLSPEALQQRESELQGWIQSELDWAGLGKITNVGKPINPDLEAFRDHWAAVDPAIAPFLGTWIKDWDLMPHDYMTVLPSTVPGQVCLVRYRQMETEFVPIQIITTPLEFSVALVEEGQLRAPAMQTARSLIRLTPGTPYVPYDIEFLGTVEASGNLRLYAAQQPPTLDPAWAPDLTPQLSAYQCTDALP
jgi:hypothetical protein